VFLAPLSELGTFQIVRLLGSGGMGDVYLALDRLLNRSVAVKVLHDEDLTPHHRERFEHEARAASTLSHPNVAHIYQLGETPDGRRYLAMEYVEGDSLDQRLIEPFPLDGALDVAIQIGSAVAAAHDAGIIHRDIKPANVILRRDGLAKVLDFGLAKIAPVAAVTAEHVPTPSIPVTEPGSLLGTADYMSPEQARGLHVDARTDIWALGVVLYEMVAGHRPFEGPTRADVLAAVLEREPAPLSRSGVAVPAELQRIVGKALRKDPGRRYQGMKDLLLDLEALRDDASPRQRPSTRWSRWGRAALWALAAASAALLVVARWSPGGGQAAAPTHRLSAELGADGTLATTDAPFVLSRDGMLVAFVARPRGQATARLYIRRLDQLAATPVPGTEGAEAPCFSPDAQWLAFFADGKLKKVPVTGAGVVTLADAPHPRGAWWSEDGTIVYAPHFRMGLMRVSSSGGPASPVTTLANGEISHRFPQVLPGGRAVLFTASTEVNIGAGAAVVLQPLPSGPRTILHRGGYFARYVPSGHIVFVEDAALVAMAFDLRRLTVTGPARRFIEGVEANAVRGSGHVAMSDTGILVYALGRQPFDARPMVWMDRAGALRPLRSEGADWKNPEFSPDGRRIAMDIRGNGHTDIWVYDWSQGVITRVTTEPTNEEFPVWTSDGTALVYRSFSSSVDPSSTLYVKRADGAGAAAVLARGSIALRPGSWHPTGNVLAYVATVPGRDDDVMMLPLERDGSGGWKAGPPAPFATSAARERQPRFSPDGRWLAYSSDETGREQVYVQPFRGAGGRVVASVTDGVGPAWSRARPELVFTSRVVDYQHALMVVGYRAQADAFHVDRPRPWAQGAPTLPELSGYRMYALHPDGERIALAALLESDTTSTHLTFAFDLFDELRRNTLAKP
jgi:predicted Ser/Thr protein kinase